MDEKIDERRLMRVPFYEDFKNDYIHLANDLIGEDIAFATTSYVNNRLAEINSRSRRSINEHPDLIRKELEHTFASKFAYDNSYENHLTGRTNANSEVSANNVFSAYRILFSHLQVRMQKYRKFINQLLM